MSQQEFRSILKISAITGATRVATILASFLRGKLVAIYAGPAGMGVLALYTTSLSVISSAASLGIDTSGVRQVAADAKYEQAISETIVAMRRLCWFTGALAALVCIGFSDFISELTFGSRANSTAISVLSVSVFLGQITLGQSALLKGLRKTRELAIQSIVTAFLSLIGAFACLYFGGEKGIVPMMLIASVVTVAGTWWYARKINLAKTAQTGVQTINTSKSLVKLGVAFMASSLISSAGTYCIAIMIQEHGGSVANGNYQAAWTVSVSLTGLMLSGMGQDFYPRLAEVADDRCTATDLVHRQMEIGILLALPALAGLSAFAPYVIQFFYSNDFALSAKAIPWLAVGCFGRAFSWPMAYLLLAKKLGRTFLLTECVSVGIHICLSLVLINFLGLTGASIAFALLYLLYPLGMSLVTRRIGLPLPKAPLVAFALFGYAILLTLTCTSMFVSALLVFATACLSFVRIKKLTGWTC